MGGFLGFGGGGSSSPQMLIPGYVRRSGKKLEKLAEVNPYAGLTPQEIIGFTPDQIAARGMTRNWAMGGTPSDMTGYLDFLRSYVQGGESGPLMQDVYNPLKKESLANEAASANLWNRRAQMSGAGLNSRNIDSGLVQGAGYANQRDKLLSQLLYTDLGNRLSAGGNLFNLSDYVNNQLPQSKARALSGIGQEEQALLQAQSDAEWNYLREQALGPFQSKVGIYSTLLGSASPQYYLPQQQPSGLEQILGIAGLGTQMLGEGGIGGLLGSFGGMGAGGMGPPAPGTGLLGAIGGLGSGLMGSIGGLGGLLGGAGAGLLGLL